MSKINSTTPAISTPDDHPQKLPTTPGVYVIRNIINNKVYVGSAINLRSRWSSHRGNLERGEHDNRHLQAAWNKYGSQNFKFDVVEHVDDNEILIDMEQFYIDSFDSCDHEKGYNLSPTAGSTLGVKYTEEAKAKLSESARERWKNPTYRSKWIDTAVKRLANPEERAKMGDYIRQGQSAPEVRARMSESAKKRCTPEHIARFVDAVDDPEVHAKVSESQTKRWADPEIRPKLMEAAKVRMTDEVRAKISAANSGKTRTPEMRARISSGMKGRVVTDATRAKMSVSMSKPRRINPLPNQNSFSFMEDEP